MPVRYAGNGAALQGDRSRPAFQRSDNIAISALNRKTVNRRLQWLACLAEGFAGRGGFVFSRGAAVDSMKAQRNPMADIGLDVLEDTLSYYIRSINIAISRDLDRSLDGLEVARGTGKITTLLLVDRHPGIRPSVIARMILRDRSAMVRLVDQMAESGLLTREAAPDDNRAQGLFITGRGRAVAERIRPLVVKQSRDFFPDITDEEHAMLIRVLGRTYRRIVGLEPDDFRSKRPEI